MNEAGRQHDIAYSINKDLSARHKADETLENLAWQRVLSNHASLGEKASAWLVTNIMMAKRKLGMDVKTLTTPLETAIKKAKRALHKQKTIGTI